MNIPNPFSGIMDTLRECNERSITMNHYDPSDLEQDEQELEMTMIRLERLLAKGHRAAIMDKLGTFIREHALDSFHLHEAFRYRREAAE